MLSTMILPHLDVYEEWSVLNYFHHGSNPISLHHRLAILAHKLLCALQVGPVLHGNGRLRGVVLEGEAGGVGDPGEELGEGRDGRGPDLVTLVYLRGAALPAGGPRTVGLPVPKEFQCCCMGQTVCQTLVS